MRNRQPIGVFDSGIGGVTVLDALIDALPHEDFIYLGDTLNCPYGTKPPHEIANLVSNVVRYLLKQNVKAIVIACNTATANSEHLKDITDIPIIGVIEPTALKALEVSKNKHIAVLSTQATLDSKSYLKILKNENTEIYSLACPEFVELVESGHIKTLTSFKVVNEKLQNLKDKNIDTFVMGCTHFGLLEKEILSAVGKVDIVECGKPTSETLYKILKENNLLNNQKYMGKVIINTTKDPKEMQHLISWFTKKYFGVYKVEL